MHAERVVQTCPRLNAAKERERSRMTVCIVAASTPSVSKPKHVVLCADYRMSTALGFADNLYKQHTIIGGWLCLGAGLDSEILRLVVLLRHQFRSAGQIDDPNVTALVRAALNERKREKADELTQGRYAMSYGDFLTIGREKLPPDIHREAVLSIADINLRASLIIVGWIDTFPCIIETTDKCTAHMREDFATIGEGAYLAQASLLQREQGYNMDLSATLYNVYEAKRYAERLPSVGPTTSITVVREDGIEYHVGAKAGTRLETLYEKFGPQQTDASQLRGLHRLLRPG